MSHEKGIMGLGATRVLLSVQQVKQLPGPNFPREVAQFDDAAPIPVFVLSVLPYALWISRVRSRL